MFNNIEVDFLEIFETWLIHTLVLTGRVYNRQLSYLTDNFVPLENVRFDPIQAGGKIADHVVLMTNEKQLPLRTRPLIHSPNANPVDEFLGEPLNSQRLQWLIPKKVVHYFRCNKTSLSQLDD